MKHSPALLLVILLPMLVSVSLADTAPADTLPDVPTLGVLLKVMEESPILYIVDLLDSTQTDSLIMSRRLNGSDWYLVTGVDGETALQRHQVGDSLGLLFGIAESAYEARDYSTAIAAYQDVIRNSPNFDPALVYLGDAYFGMEQYDSARTWYQKAVEANFINYQAHWFLADALWALGDSAGAVNELTTAHLLNVNHPAIKKSLVTRRREIGRPWKEVNLVPVCSVSGGDSVRIRTNTDWFTFGMAKAVFDYEPGFAERYEVETGTGWSERKARIVFALWVEFMERREDPDEINKWKETIGFVNSVVEGGHMGELVWYTVILPDWPQAAFLMSRESLDLIKEFVDRYY